MNNIFFILTAAFTRTNQCEREKFCFEKSNEYYSLNVVCLIYIYIHKYIILNELLKDEGKKMVQAKMFKFNF